MRQQPRFRLSDCRKSGYLSADGSLSFSSPMENETMVLNLRIDREKLEKLEYILTWYELYGEKRYTPDAYLAEFIEREYARVA